MATWDYGESICDARRELLEACPPFDDVVRAIRGSMIVLCAHWDPCKDHAEYFRPVWSVSADQGALEQFFNSANGYRGRYFANAYSGLDANAHFLAAVQEALLDSITSSHEGVQASESLQALSAKVWLAESGNEVCRSCTQCAGEWSASKDDVVEIKNGRWEVADDAKAKDGRRAPQITKLRVFGAFLDDKGNEWVACRKRLRHLDLFRFGWS
jgi:hypothetical protein